MKRANIMCYLVNYVTLTCYQAGKRSKLISDSVGKNMPGCAQPVGRPIAAIIWQGRGRTQDVLRPPGTVGPA